MDAELRKHLEDQVADTERRVVVASTTPYPGPTLAERRRIWEIKEMLKRPATEQKS